MTDTDKRALVADARVVAYRTSEPAETHGRMSVRITIEAEIDRFTLSEVDDALCDKSQVELLICYGNARAIVASGVDGKEVER